MRVKNYRGLARGLGKEAEGRTQDVRRATGSVFAEVPGEFSAEFEADVAAHVRGVEDHGSHELAHRAVGCVFQPAARGSVSDPYVDLGTGVSYVYDYAWAGNGRTQHAWTSSSRGTPAGNSIGKARMSENNALAPSAYFQGTRGPLVRLRHSRLSEPSVVASAPDLLAASPKRPGCGAGPRGQATACSGARQSAQLRM